MEYIKTSSKSLLNIINDILDFSKIEARKLDLEFIDTDLITLLEEVIDIVQYQASIKHLELVLNFDPEMPAIVNTDPIRLKQILVNLLGNAIKFTERGSVVIQVDYEPYDEFSGRYQFNVIDTGIGMTESQLQLLFKAFSQADSSTTRKYGGTGLGLAISSLLAEKMGSKILVSTEQGVGSTFSLDLKMTCRHRLQVKPKLYNSMKVLLSANLGENTLKSISRILAAFGIVSEIISFKEPSKVDTISANMIMLHYTKDKDFLKAVEKSLNKKIRLWVADAHHPEDIQEIKERSQIKLEFIKLPVKYNDLFQKVKGVDLQENETSVVVSQSVSLREGQFDLPTKILIAEDVKTNAELLKILLQSVLSDVSIDIVYDGKQAVEKCQEKSFDLIFMDVQMPVMDGIDAVKIIRQSSPHQSTPIIALSAGVLQEEQALVIESGMDFFMAKPIDVNQLHLVLEQFLKPVASQSDKMPDQAPLNFHEIHDKNALLQLIGYNENHYNEILKLGQVELIPRLNNLLQSLKSNDVVDLKFQLHAIKGLAISLHLESLKTQIESIEDTIKESKPLSNQQVLDVLLAEYDQIKATNIFSIDNLT